MFSYAHSTNDNDIWKDYIKQIRQIPILSTEDEQELAKLAKLGNVTAKEKFIISNLRLVLKIIQKIYAKNMSKMDLVQEGNLALIQVFEKYDPYLSCFSTFAVPAIRNHMLQYVADFDYLIRIPINSRRQFSDILKSEKELISILPYSPNIEEIAHKSGYSTGKVLSLYLASTQIDSLDRQIEREDGSVQDVGSSLSGTSDIESEVATELLINKMLDALQKLSKKEQYNIHKCNMCFWRCRY
mgnify:CR=1 FL=1